MNTALAGWAALLLVATLPASAVTLYDATRDTTPQAQGWTPLVQGAAAAQSTGAGAYSLDTTGSGVSIWGNAILAPLDTVTGFDLAFTLKIDSESHASANRAGYSVLLVGSDATKALELAFWQDQVWSYDYVAADPDRFVHGAGAAFDTTAGLTSYLLQVRNQQFTLRAGGNLLLSGALRDYTAGGVPYTTSNLLFFGDDTSRGTSVSRLGTVVLTPVPEPAAALLLAAGLAALAWRQRGTGRGVPRESIAT